ncbi:MAG: hypothetical protein HFH74_15950 [Lachnospiraceae bacterium]|jgi:hypothetical protein|nr:hypothetical protein [Lachnospiraceae bacterium]
MSENTEPKQTEEHKPHFVKTIGNTTYLVTCHFSETSKETLQDKLKRMILRDIQSGNY